MGAITKFKEKIGGVEVGGVKCKSSAKTAAGEVITATLDAEVGLIEAAKEEVGVEMRPAKAGGLFAKFTCGKVKVESRGGVIGVITPVNTPVNSGQHFSLDYAAAEGGGQAVTHFEGGATTTLEARTSKKKPFTPATLVVEEEIEPNSTQEITTGGGTDALIQPL